MKVKTHCYVCGVEHYVESKFSVVNDMPCPACYALLEAWENGDRSQAVVDAEYAEVVQAMYNDMACCGNLCGDYPEIEELNRLGKDPYQEASSWYGGK